MSNILIINGAKKFAHSNGQLNDTLTEVADGFLRDAGHDVKVVRTDGDYDIQAEVQNFLWADVVIWQMPGWWMGAPWTVKKYMDDVFTEGHGFEDHRLFVIGDGGTGISDIDTYS
jgi:modulator of drug activity B